MKTRLRFFALGLTLGPLNAHVALTLKLEAVPVRQMQLQ
jgi:hypothetical protein